MSKIEHVKDLNEVLSNSRSDMMNYISQSMNSVISILNGRNKDLDKVYTDIDILGRKKIPNYKNYCNNLPDLKFTDNIYIYDSHNNMIEYRKFDDKNNKIMFEFIPNTGVKIVIDNFFNITIYYHDNGKNQQVIFYLKKNYISFPFLCFYCSLNYIDNSIFNYGDNCSKNLLKDLTHFLNNTYKKGIDVTINIKENVSEIFNNYLDFDINYPEPRFTRSNSNFIKYSLTYKSCNEKMNGLRLLFEKENDNNTLDNNLLKNIEEFKNKINTKNENILLLQDKIRELEDKDNFNYNHTINTKKEIKNMRKQIRNNICTNYYKNFLIILILIVLLCTLNYDYSNETMHIYNYFENNLNYAQDRVYYFLHTMSEYNFTYVYNDEIL
jgi:hypothetical protein